MASQTVPEVVIRYPMPPSSDTPPPRGWWSRPIVTLPALHDREATCTDFTAFFTPCCGGIFTVIAVLVFITHVIDNTHCDAKFSIQSIAVSPSSATWHVDFLVKNPSPRYTIYYGGDETAARLGPLNAAVLNASHERKSRSHTAFSVDFAAEGNPNNEFSKQLDIKLSAKLTSYGEDDPRAGHVDLFANSISVSNANANANVSVADWTIGFAARSPITNCKMSFQTLKSRLLRGDQVISNSLPPMSEYIGQFVAGDMANVVFEKVVMPEVIGDVIWDFRVEVKYAMHINAGDVTVLVMAVCPDIPVKFTTDSAGNMMGSLLGNMRRCDYIIQDQLLNPLRS
ncbi:uncharacterized protein LOC9308061 [Arabidopsis lyrata subsp. lyrata]|uniref:uncharacterized protein LOC9308061 n=1 Tax=Arabidopsis lyrata subsp. lyrata TaxID=81972 RepID=UPI000A29BCF6|nr:uncharacterized protein LOC9308061 [Arabidopsis lyrata subsp. lyrata]|eukprot:XP_020875791.1 uncharacterized protein LOC9308061 [Arabidopsis lyrata subsp. lyrata]